MALNGDHNYLQALIPTATLPPSCNNHRVVMHAMALSGTVGGTANDAGCHRLSQVHNYINLQVMTSKHCRSWLMLTLDNNFAPFPAN